MSGGGLCPWDGLVRVPSEFCEESLCAWVRQPANTWSNIGFFIAAALIAREARRDGARHLEALAYIAFWTGLTSAIYHASETFLGRIADYSGMYLGAAFMLSINIRRLTLCRPAIARAVFWASFVALLGFMVVSPGVAAMTYGVETTVCCVGLELVLYIRQGRRIRYRWLLRYWGVFFIGYAAWLLDRHHIVCAPGNHILTGHGVWHLLDAYALLLLYRYYAQFPELKPLRIP